MRRRQFLALVALGVLGVLSLRPVAIARMPLPAGAPPRQVIILRSMPQPTILVAIAVGAAASLFAPARRTLAATSPGTSWLRSS
jgi:hypothetical protein